MAVISKERAADVQAQGSGLGTPARSWVARYGFATAVSIVSVLVSLAFMPATDAPVYSLLVAAVAVSVWYGGLGPALLALVLGWTFSFWLFVGSLGHPETASRDDLLRWSVPLFAAAGVIWVALVMRRGRERAVVAAGEAEATVRGLEAVQQVARALTAALTPSDVAHVLIGQTPALVGAYGGALGLVDGEELVVVDPAGVARQTHPVGRRFALDARAPIARAARNGSPVVVGDRETFEREFADGAALSPYAHAAIAVPLFVAGQVVGAMSILFDESGSVDPDDVAIAALAADLGGQALERARLYERELEASQALDRILRVAPRLHAQSPESVAEAICREARVTFGADLAALWRLTGDRLTLTRSNPPLDPLPPDLEVPLDDFPGLLNAVGTLQVSFVSDIREEARGAGLERVRELGIQSSLRAPIVVGDHAEMVLIISWQTEVAEPDQSTILLVRRFTDQAGLALEQVERRLAQDEASRRVREVRRLQEVTAALSQAATAAEIAETCLEHALTAFGADRGLLAVVRPDGDSVELLANRGYADPEVQSRNTVELEARIPACYAIRSDEAVWAFTEAEVATLGPLHVQGDEPPDRGVVAVPFKAGSDVRGALQLSFRGVRELADDERRGLRALVIQCAQALERSRFYDEEQRLRRRSERLQSMTAQLSGAITRQDVADVAVGEIAHALGAEGAALAVVADERQLLTTMSWKGYGDELVEPWLEVPLDAPTPGNRALRRRRLVFFADLAEIREEFPDEEWIEATGHVSFLFVPLVAGRQASGLVTLSWRQRYVLSDEDRAFVETLASQAAQALDRAQHFESEQTIAETLQRSVLPVSLPHVEGLQLAARYLPGTAELDVGGDWFDAIRLPDGRLGLVVGDVVGKGLQAAATMAQLRNALRAFSLDRMKPSSTVARLNQLAEEVVDTAFATLAYVVVDPDGRVCRFTSAGHPPPLVAYPDGKVVFLEGGRGLPLGTGSASTYGQDVVTVPAGTTLLLYTDGLVERRDRSIDDGLERLRQAVSDGARDPERLVDHVLDRLVGHDERGDDIAVLAVRLLALAPEPLELRVPTDPASLELVRDALRVWLEPTPLDAADSHDVVLATWEACANAIEHAQSPRENVLEVVAETRPSSIRVSVHDSGHWSVEAARSDRGLGRQLMRSAMSSVEIVSDEDGTTVLLEKQLDGADIEIASTR